MIKPEQGKKYRYTSNQDSIDSFEFIIYQLNIQDNTADIIVNKERYARIKLSEFDDNVSLSEQT